MASNRLIGLQNPVMQAITRYIFGQLLAAVLVITLGLTLAVWLTQSLRWMGYIVNRGLPAATFLSFVGLLLPSFLGVVLPVATFCAVLFVYNKLMMDSELVVLRATGWSQLQLGRPALILALLATLTVYSISLYFLPVSFRAFKDLQYRIRNDYSAVLLQEGVFNTVSDALTVYVRERMADGELRGILVHDNRDPEKPVTMLAERAALVQGETGPRVVMFNGNRQQVAQEGGNLSLLYFDRYTVELASFRETIHTRWREPKEQFLPALFHPSPTGADKKHRNELIAEGHQRLVAPLYTLAFVMVGLAALLSGEFNRRGQLRRVVFAILCVAVLEAASLALHDLSSRWLQAVPAMYAAAVLPILVSLVVLVRAPRRRQPMSGPARVAAP